MLNSIQRIYELFLLNPVICHDSRRITLGCIYWALKGENFDGNVFTEEAFEKGASYAVIDDPLYQVNDNCILVDNTLAALQELARQHRTKLGIKILAITGSNGKTTTRELTVRVLAKKHPSFATPGNLNNHIGLPLSLLQLRKEHKSAVIELGANHKGENAALCEICLPDEGLITNIGKDHLEGFGGLDGVEAANMELFDYIRIHKGLAYINADDSRITKHTAGLNGLSYGADKGDVNLHGKILSRFPLLKCEIRDMKSLDAIEIQSQLFGAYHLYNIMAAAAVGLKHGISLADIRDAIESYAPANNRSQIVQKGSNTYIMDAYNANPSSMEGSIRDFTDYPAGNKVLILGDMFELGEESEKEHAAMLRLVDPYNFKKVILVGRAFGALQPLQGASFFETTEAAKEWFQKQSWENCTFYLKGSRGMRLEEIVKSE